MLTNHLIGAGQNVSAHTPRGGTPAVENAPPVSPPARIDAASDHITLKPVIPPEDAKKATDADVEKPSLEVPERVKMTIAVVDSIPDAVPESIYDAKVSDDEA